MLVYFYIVLLNTLSCWIDRISSCVLIRTLRLIWIGSVGCGLGPSHTKLGFKRTITMVARERGWGSCCTHNVIWCHVMCLHSNRFDSPADDDIRGISRAVCLVEAIQYHHYHYGSLEWWLAVNRFERYRTQIVHRSLQLNSNECTDKWSKCFPIGRDNRNYCWS